MMRYSEHRPSLALAGVVECLWTLRAPAGTRGHRVLPDGSVDILFDASGPTFAVGAMTAAIVTEPVAEACDLLGVRFRPGEASSFLGVPLRELMDDSVDLASLWGARGRSVADAILETRPEAERMALVERVLIERLASTSRTLDAHSRRVRVAVSLLRGPGDIPTIDDLSTRLGVTSRTLERAFDERVGLPPKMLHRVVRLQRLVAALDRGDRSWAALAAHHGFADQAHLVREVRALAGVTPTALLRERRAMSDSFKSAATLGVTVPPAIASGDEGRLG